MDAVQKANSGHPGAPMGMADIAEVLWNDFLKHNPENPQWYDRDRFILSNGHASMLLYSLLHLTGYDLPIEEIKTSVSCIQKPRATRRLAIRRGGNHHRSAGARTGECGGAGYRRAHAGGAV
jgi:transketolase N-terminal domain/subunit